MEVMPDHVHLLIDINPRLGVYHVVNQIKGYSSSVFRAEYYMVLATVHHMRFVMIFFLFIAYFHILK